MDSVSGEGTVGEERVMWPWRAKGDTRAPLPVVQWVNTGYSLTMGDSICLSKTLSLEGERGEYGRFNREEDRLRDLGMPVGFTNTPESPRELALGQLSPGS